MAWMKKRVAKKRVPKYKKRAIRHKSKLGGFYIRRRINTFNILASQTVAGAVTTSNSLVMKLGTAVASATGQTGFYDVPFSMEFRLDQLDTYTDITSIADKYKLTSANVRICGPNTVSIQSAPLPYIEYVREEDDSVAPSVGDLNQKMGLRTTGFNQRGQCNMRFRPVPSGLLYNGGASSALAVPIRAPYINCSNPAVPHYAVKGVIRGFQANGSGTPSAFTVAVTLGVSVRDLQ